MTDRNLSGSPQKAEVVEVQDQGNGMVKIILLVGGTLMATLIPNKQLQAQCGIDGIQPQIAQNSTFPIENTSSTTAAVQILSGNYPSTIGVEDSNGIPGNTKAFSGGESGSILSSATTALGIYNIRISNSGAGCVDTVQVEVVATLPVEKSEESVEQIKPHTSKLAWTTATEINNKGFPIMKSTNGIDWEELDFVDSRAEGGNFSGELSYELLDKECYGVTYYTIDQVDLDGKYTEGTVLSVQCDINEVIAVGPNPTNGLVNIDVQGDQDITYDIQIVGMDGSSFSFGTVNTNEPMQVNMQDLPAGTYNIFLSSKTGVAKNKSFKTILVK